MPIPIFQRPARSHTFLIAAVVCGWNCEALSVIYAYVAGQFGSLLFVEILILTKAIDKNSIQCLYRLKPIFAVCSNLCH